MNVRGDGFESSMAASKLAHETITRASPANEPSVTLSTLVIVGTRPEVVKLAPVVLELQGRPREFAVQVVATGQHREMLDQALTLFGIKPAHDLGIMAPNQSLASITSRAVEGLDAVFETVRPDVVLVQGDTTTAMCGSLVAHYHRVAVGHVEAGLRTGNKYAPFPEEMNRRLIGRLADLHFAPTERAAQALRDELVPNDDIFCTGNTVVDALLWVRERVRKQSPPIPSAVRTSLDGRDMVLVTGHRRENFGQGFENICRAIRDVADRFEDVVFVYPVHLNPNVRGPTSRLLGNHDRILLIEPLAYEPFVWLMDRATVVLTDSGGVQEEAPSLGKPVLVMRDTTERPEGVEAGNAMLVGTDRTRIAVTLARLLSDPTERSRMAAIANPYGDGLAAGRIADALVRRARQLSQIG